MLCGPRARSPESGLHFALAVGARHALPPLLATETPDRVPASDVSAVHNRRDND